VELTTAYRHGGGSNTLQHSIRGMISPTEFIPMAEETGLIHVNWRLGYSEKQPFKQGVGMDGLRGHEQVANLRGLTSHRASSRNGST